jgi:NO-binding membrane sensor protein with MHYT domain
VPIFVLLLAFYVVSTSAEVLWWRIGVSGIFAGCSICGMHFIGNISISNYRCTYATINIVGAGIIAITASIVALSLFFVFRAAWTSTWWKRLGCSVVLAGAVSGMHWCAAVGTTFRLVYLKDLSESNGRNMTVIVVSCLVRCSPIPLAGRNLTASGV